VSAGPRPWRVSDAHGLCVVDANENIVADLTPNKSWAEIPTYDQLRANAELIVSAVNATDSATISQSGWF